MLRSPPIPPGDCAVAKCDEGLHYTPTIRPSCPWLYLGRNYDRIHQYQRGEELRGESSCVYPECRVSLCPTKKTSTFSQCTTAERVANTDKCSICEPSLDSRLGDLLWYKREMCGEIVS